jgi:hypothetical protein
VLSDKLAGKKPGDTIRLRVMRDGNPQDVEVALEKNHRRLYSIRPLPATDALQAAILKDWLPAK